MNQAARAPTPRPQGLTVRAVGAPAGVSSLAQLLLRMHAAPPLQLVPSRELAPSPEPKQA